MRRQNNHCQATSSETKRQSTSPHGLCETNNLTLGEDAERQTTIINEEAMIARLTETINQSQIDVVVDGHYAAAVVPTEITTMSSSFAEAQRTQNLHAELRIC